jgi:hypothetical protein
MSDFKTSMEIYRYLLADETREVFYNDVRVKIWREESWSFKSSEEWSKYVPPKKPIRLYCFRFTTGECKWAEEDSPAYVDYYANPEYSIVRGAVMEVEPDTERLRV